METVNLSAAVKKQGGGDLIAAFHRALAGRTSGRGLRLILEPGIYILRESECPRRFAAVSNHDSGDRAVAFSLVNEHDVEIDGCGALLLCEGRLIPFWVESSHNIRLRNFALDWVRPFSSEAEVVDVIGADEALVRIDSERFPYRLEKERFCFTGPDGYTSSYLKNALAFDADKREVALHARDTWGVRQAYSVKEAEGGLLRFRAPFIMPPEPGNLLALPHEHRTSPAVVLTRCDEVTIEDANLHHAGGMGVIAQMCRNVTLKRVTVAPRAKTGRMLSLAADASHFVECSGRLLLEDCHFNGQLDDSSNIHGVYLRVARRMDAHSLVAEAVHFQQWHVDYIQPGDKLALVDPGTLMRSEETLTVTAVERTGPALVQVTFSEALPDKVDGMALQIISNSVQTEIQGNVFERHRARGLLLSAPGRHWVHHNRFHVPGNAILAVCDCFDWFEAGAVDELLVEDNDFDNCAYGNRPFPAAIRISPVLHSRALEMNPVHRNIRVRRNRFTGRSLAMVLHRCKDICFEENDLGGVKPESKISATACEAVTLKV